ncbi:MAG: hypothetical protein GEU93_09590 [Propionibacteriales bacterium]|nr:hypothetical protein [Propionibacteriales bacterium]
MTHYDISEKKGQTMSMHRANRRRKTFVAAACALALPLVAGTATAAFSLGAPIGLPVEDPTTSVTGTSSGTDTSGSASSPAGSGWFIAGLAGATGEVCGAGSEPCVGLPADVPEIGAAGDLATGASTDGASVTGSGGAAGKNVNGSADASADGVSAGVDTPLGGGSLAGSLDGGSGQLSTPLGNGSASVSPDGVSGTLDSTLGSGQADLQLNLPNEGVTLPMGGLNGLPTP